MVAPFHKNVKVYSLDLELAIDPTPSGEGDFAHYDFIILYYISHKMKYVSPLRMAALARNFPLRTLPAKYL